MILIFMYKFRVKIKVILTFKGKIFLYSVLFNDGEIKKVRLGD